LHGSLVFELGDDYLWIGCLMDRDVPHLAALAGTGGDLLDALAELIAATGKSSMPAGTGEPPSRFARCAAHTASRDGTAH
jgi:hypothetical protein